MSIETLVKGANDCVAEVRETDIDGNPCGIVALTRDLYLWKQRSIFFVDDDGSNDMAINGATGGTTENVHDGTDGAYWTATVRVGSTIDPASTAQANTGTKSIEFANSLNNDEIELAKGSDLDMTNYAVVSGYIYLQQINAANHQILLSFEESSTLVGSAVDVLDYVDTGLIGSWQRFVIPKSAFGVADVNIDALIVTLARSGGLRPDFYLDDIEINQNGGKKFTAAPKPGTIFEYNRLELVMVDALAGTVTGGTMPGLSYDKLLNVSSLNSGITLQRFEKGVPQIAVNFKNLFDFESLTFDIVQHVSDGTNTMIKLRTDLPTWSRLILQDDERVEITINDDLSGLLRFRAILIGRELIEYEG